MHRLSLVFALVLSCILGASQAWAIDVVPADPVDAVAGDHVLLITNDREQHELSLAEIEALPRYQTTMLAPWGMEGTFSGVRLVDLLAHAGLADAQRLHLRAADDYKITLLPDSEEGFDQVLFITRFNGKTMDIEHKGPFRLIWPHNADTAAAGDVSTVKWIWSIVEIRKVR